MVLIFFGDTNYGRKTHVTATILGDGSGDSSTKGMAPNATFGPIN